jgi:hypothetical protein
MTYSNPLEQLQSDWWSEYSQNPDNDYYKINAQQLAKTPILLDCIEAPEGYKFVQLDYCFTEGTELLTKRGWLEFSKLDSEDLVWQVEPYSLIGSWVRPKRVIHKHYSGPIYTFGNRRGKLEVTYGHSMVWAGPQTHQREDKKRLRKFQRAENGVPSTATTMLTASNSNTRSYYSEQEIWMACMLAADGSRTPSGSYTIEVSKPHKVAQIEKLLGRAGTVRPARQNQTRDSHSWYGIKFESKLLCPETKALKLNTLGSNQVNVFVAALSFWDSSKTGYKTERFNFCSTNEVEIDSIQAYLVTSGYEARKTSGNSKSLKHKKPFYLSIRKSAGIRLRRNKDEQISDYTGMVGCVTVDHGFIQVRRDGQTFISGNCALEPTVLAEFSRDKCYHEIYASGKPHEVYLYVVCKLLDPNGKINAVYNLDNPTEESVAKTKKMFKTERTMGKIFQLMSTYKAGAPKIHRQLVLSGVDITREEVIEIRKKYWGPDLFAGIVDYEDNLLAEVDQRDGWFFNGMGRPFAVTDKKRKDVVNTHTQSTGHDLTDLMILETEKNVVANQLDCIPIIPDYHDETIWMAPIDDAESAANAMSDAIDAVNSMVNFSIPLKGEPEITDNFTQFKMPDPVGWYAEKLNDK